MKELIQQKAGAAASIAASGAVVTWIEQANQYIDFAAGITAVIASGFAIAWYIKKFREDRIDGNTNKGDSARISSEDPEP